MRADLSVQMTEVQAQSATTVSNHLVWYRTGLRCSAARKTLNNVVMTMRL